MRSFINWQLVQKEGDEEPTKVPTNAATGYPVNPMDPANWLTKEQAEATGWPVGVIITPPYFVVDLDKCLGPDGWSAYAVGVCERFPGAAIEVSQSGTGLHIFGRYDGPFPAHRKKPVKELKHLYPGTEFYTEKRFIALGRDMHGSWETIHTPAALQFASELGEPAPTVAGGSADWTTEADSEWNGPDDDEKLIEIMLKSKPSGAVALGVKASVQDLWVGDEDVLAKFFPETGNKGRAFGASEADAALCGHLSFWTGKNCERMDRMFRLSGLMQHSKWDDRPDYVERTIIGAVAQGSGVYQSRELASVAAPLATDTTATAIRGTERQGYQMLTTSQQLDFFAGCVYVRDPHRILIPDGGLLKQAQFEVIYGGYFFVIDSEGNTSKSAWEAFTGSKVNQYPWAHRLAFRPEEPVGAIIEEEGTTWVNTYVPISTRRIEGDAGPFIEHAEKLFPVESDRNIILAYLAACVQYPGTKFQWWPVVQGMEGNGKSLFTRVMMKALGEKYCHLVKPKKLANDFNGWVDRKLFVGIEEIRVGNRRDIIDDLKPLVTDDKIAIELKGIDEVLGDNRANGWCNSNYGDAVFKSVTDRRYSVFFTPQQEDGDLEKWGMDGTYFPDLYSWLKADGYAIVANWLARYDIPDALNPATLSHRAPNTTSTKAAIEASYGPVEQEILEAIRSEAQGFRGQWVSSSALTILLDKTHHKLSHSARREALKNIQYIPHPNLEKGRSNKVISQEGGGRPVLYVKKGSINLNHVDPTAAYLKAQGYQTIEGAHNAATKP